MAQQQDDVPGFFFNIEQFFGSVTVQRMSFAEKGVYLVMLFEQWRNAHRSLPDDAAACASLIAVTPAQVKEVHRAWNEVRKKFVTSKHNQGRIYNIVMERMWRTQRVTRTKLREAGRKAGKASASKRQHPQQLVVNDRSTTVERPLNDRIRSVERPLNDRSQTVYVALNDRSPTVSKRQHPQQLVVSESSTNVQRPLNDRAPTGERQFTEREREREKERERERTKEKEKERAERERESRARAQETHDDAPHDDAPRTAGIPGVGDPTGPIPAAGHAIRVRAPTVLVGSLPREHASHVFCDPTFTVCVPAAVHAKFIGPLSRKYGGDREQAQAALRTWYAQQAADLPAGAVMGDAFRFWQPRFDATFAAPAPVSRAPSLASTVHEDAEAVRAILKRTGSA